MEGDSLKVALFGGTGFVGSYIVDELVYREHQPRLMVRPGSEGKVPKLEYCEIVSGDIHDDYAIRETLYDCDAAIYLIAVIKEFPKEGITNELLQFRGAQRVANVALEVGVKRFLLMSALGTNCRPGVSKYFKAKHLAEQAVKKHRTKLDHPEAFFHIWRSQGIWTTGILYFAQKRYAKSDTISRISSLSRTGIFYRIKPF